MLKIFNIGNKLILGRLLLSLVLLLAGNHQAMATSIGIQDSAGSILTGPYATNTTSNCYAPTTYYVYPYTPGSTGITSTGVITGNGTQVWHFFTTDNVSNIAQAAGQTFSAKCAGTYRVTMVDIAFGQILPGKSCASTPYTISTTLNFTIGSTTSSTSTFNYTYTNSNSDWCWIMGCVYSFTPNSGDSAAHGIGATTTNGAAPQPWYSSGATSFTGYVPQGGTISLTSTSSAAVNTSAPSCGFVFQSDTPSSAWVPVISIQMISAGGS